MLYIKNPNNTTDYSDKYYDKYLINQFSIERSFFTMKLNCEIDSHDKLIKSRSYAGQMKW